MKPYIGVARVEVHYNTGLFHVAEPDTPMGDFCFFQRGLSARHAT